MTMPKYSVSVRVDFNYDVEADNAEAAIQEGWNWENYRMFSSVYEIDVDRIDEDEEEEELV
jgi:hypothetical protein